jgi:hypothetical protein
MSFGRNPHVAKAEAAEQKALVARDDIARERALREAAHEWDRAANRERDPARKQLYADKAAALRAGPESADLPDHDEVATGAEPASTAHAAKKDPSQLN